MDDFIEDLKTRLMDDFDIMFKEKTITNIINMLTNEFATGVAKKTYAECVFIEKHRDVREANKKDK